MKYFLNSKLLGFIVVGLLAMLGSTPAFAASNLDDPPEAPWMKLVSIEFKETPMSESIIRGGEANYYLSLVYRVYFPNHSRKKHFENENSPFQTIITRTRIGGQFRQIGKPQKLRSHVGTKQREYFYIVLEELFTEKPGSTPQRIMLRWVANPGDLEFSKDPYAQTQVIPDHFDSKSTTTFEGLFSDTPGSKSPRPVDLGPDLLNGVITEEILIREAVARDGPSDSAFADGDGDGKMPEFWHLGAEYHSGEFELDFESLKGSAPLQPPTLEPNPETERDCLAVFSKSKSTLHSPGDAPDLSLLLQYLEQSYPQYIGIRTSADHVAFVPTPISARYAFEIRLLKAADVSHLTGLLKMLNQRLLFILANSDYADASMFSSSEIQKLSMFSDSESELDYALKEFKVRILPAAQNCSKNVQ